MRTFAAVLVCSLCTFSIKAFAEEKPAEAPLPEAVGEDAQQASTALYKEGLKIQKEEKDLARAIAKWEEALKTDPRNAKCMNHYAWFLAVDAGEDRRDVARAIELSTLAARITEWKDRDIIDTVAEAHYQNKNYERAIATLEKAYAPETTTGAQKKYLDGQMKKFKDALAAATASKENAEKTGAQKEEKSAP